MTRPAQRDDFYDPELYEKRIGPGSRVGKVYLDEVQKHGGPVLEIGCGTGDVLLPIARAGVRVYGIDASPRMLDTCRSRAAQEPAEVRERIQLASMKMQTMDALPGAFQQVFIPNDAIAHVLTLEDLQSTLRGCYRLLRPGGRLVFDGSDFDVEYLGRCAGSASELLRFRGRYPFDADIDLQVWERTHYDKNSGVLSADFRYEYLDATGTVSRAVHRTLRLVPRRIDELISAVGHAGFGSVAVARLADHVLSGDGYILSALRP